MFNWVNKLENVVTDHQEIEKFLPEIKEKLATLDREELLKRVVHLSLTGSLMIIDMEKI